MTSGSPWRWNKGTMKRRRRLECWNVAPSIIVLFPLPRRLHRPNLCQGPGFAPCLWKNPRRPTTTWWRTRRPLIALLWIQEPHFTAVSSHAKSTLAPLLRLDEIGELTERPRIRSSKPKPEDDRTEMVVLRYFKNLRSLRKTGPVLQLQCLWWHERSSIPSGWFPGGAEG